MNNKFPQTSSKLVAREINQIAIFKANRLMVQDLVILNCEKNITIHIFEFNDNCKL